MRGVIDMVDTLVTAPVPAMTVEYARAHIRSLGHEEDLLIRSWIQAASQYFEGQTGRQIMTATREVWMDRFPWQSGVWGICGTDLRIELPRPPLQSVVSVSYIDGDGVLQTFTGGSPEVPLYQVKAPAGPYARRGWVEPVPGCTWPIPRHEGGAVRIRYVAGYGDAVRNVPELLTGILCYLVAHFDQVRAAVQEVRRGQMLELPYGVQDMMQEFKYSALPSTTPRDHGGWPWR